MRSSLGAGAGFLESLLPKLLYELRIPRPVLTQTERDVILTIVKKNPILAVYRCSGRLQDRKAQK